jgi:uncharacterized glyoxalase superfamily protein PhnB
MDPQLHARLIVRDVDGAIDHYTAALGATLTDRFTDDDDRVVHAALAIGGSAFSLSEETPEWGWVGPLALGGSPVLLQLTVADPDAVADALVAGGGEIVIPIEDRPYGKREGRVRDRAGHLWILSRPL